MSLKDEIRYCFRHDMIQVDSPLRNEKDVPVIPVKALRAWLEEQHTSIVGKATFADMLAELEGVA